MPDTLFLREGNTLFIIHKAKPGVGWFRALNADTARNFLQNGALLCWRVTRWALTRWQQLLLTRQFFRCFGMFLKTRLLKAWVIKRNERTMGASMSRLRPVEGSPCNERCR
jgi:hypothetical protein